MRDEVSIDLPPASKGNSSDSIKRLEYTLRWRRTVNIDDVAAMAEDCAPEVSLG